MENMIRIEAVLEIFSVYETTTESMAEQRLIGIREEFKKLKDRYVPDRFPEAYLKVTTTKIEN